jgi:hypothetical protein
MVPEAADLILSRRTQNAGIVVTTCKKAQFFALSYSLKVNILLSIRYLGRNTRLTFFGILRNFEYNIHWYHIVSHLCGHEIFHWRFLFRMYGIMHLFREIFNEIQNKQQVLWRNFAEKIFDIKWHQILMFCHT